MEYLDFIREKYDITTEDHKELIRSLKLVLSKLHPDLTGGDFIDEYAKKEYYIVDRLINDLDSSEGQLKQVEKYTLLELKEMLPELTKQNKILKENIHNSKNDYLQKIESRKIDIKKNNTRIKITSASVFSLISGLFFFPNQLMDNFFLSEFIERFRMEFFAIWLLILFITINIWIHLKIIEDKQMMKLEYYENDNILSSIFDKFIANIYTRKFTRRDFNMYLHNIVNSIEHNKKSKSLFDLFKKSTNLPVYLVLHVYALVISIIAYRNDFGLFGAAIILITCNVALIYQFNKFYSPRNVATRNILENFSIYIFNKALDKDIIKNSNTNTVEDYYEIVNPSYSA